jgi:hypothetical protein
VLQQRDVCFLIIDDQYLRFQDIGRNIHGTPFNFTCARFDWCARK